MLLRMYDPETLAKYDNLTPTTLDQLADYADAVVKLPFTFGRGAASGDAVKTMLPSTAASANDHANGRTFQQYLSFPYNTLASPNQWFKSLSSSQRKL